ncbi:MAG TPA: TonB-dependent receptor plug domain-containing protein [Terriglobales bacterium]|nr:TonB-dependent receptor plug domain-containing protein [Terriglobales bacterium]HZP34379.1 TonB-dependent receptor plug domain-containing protein [Candidatus Acidoferrales bacterium]
MSPLRKNKFNFVASSGRILLLGMLMVSQAANVSASGAAGPQNVPDYASMSLEDLMNQPVTSVTKHTQKVGDSAAAIFVITQEDIRRSGATSIPDALRMVPGVEVAQIDQNKWAIASRGFNGRFDDKLLVLIDGRSVYTPLFSGVYWNIEDVVLEDVDRIEVIRGPGATLWGANAVNGVINIITKSAKNTQGALVSVGAGSQEATAETVRYGSKVGDTYYRVYGKYFDWYPSIDSTGATASDGWHAIRSGFRVDSNATTRDSLTVQGDIYHDNFGETLTIPSLTSPTFSSTYPNNNTNSGGDLLGRWNHSFARSSTSLQMYYDRTNIFFPTIFSDHESVYDIDFQHDIHLGENQELVWGLGYRSIQDNNASTFTVAVVPDHSSLNQYSAFVQDEIGLLDNRMHVTVGSKFEHNPFTGFEFEPNIRVLGTLTQKQSVWAAVSRAVRTPAITEEGLQLNAGILPPNTPPANSPLPVVEGIFGSPLFASEHLLAYEIGYRVQATNSVSLDIAAFYNNYTNLRSAEPGAPIVVGSPVPSYVIQPFVASNKMSGGTYGIEPFAEWRILPQTQGRPIAWKLSASYSYLQMNIHKNADSLDPTPDIPNGLSPRNQAYFRSSLDLPKHVEQDLIVRYVDRLQGLNIPSYTSLDLHIGWRPVTPMQLSFGAWDLLNTKQIEFIPDFINTLPTEVRRTWFGSISWTF